ncbi:tripartite tricarboxylate transporter TctB family protein [Lentilitoribacter sp. EG35]|uniref:tripartite tricarboxylate transporter TctB family protein n=1 Tax=Lentilitoribacter sp. EG35 TaxID=3234192 RepID=UPI003460FE23
MTQNRLQHIIPGGLILALALTVAWLSFTQEPAESFLFPRLISSAFVGLAIWNFLRAVLGLAKVGRGISLEVAKNITPGVVLIFIYAFWAAKGLGFYTASTLAFFVLYSLYDPAPLGSVKDWIKRAIVTVAFMLVMYGLFSILLQVQTPRGINF